MRTFWIIQPILMLLVGLHSYAVEITIKTDKEGDKPKEEEKEEKEEVELPKRGQLNINVINLSNKYDFVVTARVVAKNDPNTGMIVQGSIPKNDSLTIGSLFSIDPEASFEFTQAQVVVMGDAYTQAITCHIKYPKEEEKKEEPEKKPLDAILTIPMPLAAAKPEEQKEEKKEDKKDEKKDEKKKENSLNQAPAPDAKPEPKNEAKKSLDFYLYDAPNQATPSCIIHFDSL